jgi:hypothetical protein
MMPLLGNVPEFLLVSRYHNPSGLRNGVFQFTKGSTESIWEWIFKQPDVFANFNGFLQDLRESRLSWTSWFPVQDRIINGTNKSQSSVILVDVGGGLGHDIADFQNRFPQAPGRLILEDLAPVLQNAKGLNSAIRLQEVDFLTGQPVKGKWLPFS